MQAHMHIIEPPTYKTHKIVSCIAVAVRYQIRIHRIIIIYVIMFYVTWQKRTRARDYLGVGTA